MTQIAGPQYDRRILFSIALLAVAGIVVSSVSLFHHYGTSATTYCDIGENFNCDVVNRSSYSSILGIPVALIGLLGYSALLFLATVYRRKSETPAVLAAASFTGSAFALYLTYIEGFVLGAWCIFCLSSLVMIFGITVLSSFLWIARKRRSD
jgi:vitamin-K-epoxide reductase (warfarin-sensitive)